MIQLYVYVYIFFFRSFSHIYYYRILSIVPFAIQHQSPNFLAPGTGFVEDSFSTDRGRGDGDGSGGNASDREPWGVADEALLAGRPAAHLLLCGPVPNRPKTGTSLWPRGWGPLLYSRSLSVVYFIYSSVYMLIPNSLLDTYIKTEYFTLETCAEGS